ncbi:DUF4279 domain-containing protein [Ferruginibacter albus]|uniref:DUF4279 domain-containing protein n=1 Tax=Ferruginibacter albus TaxID=2875540 RepID=UPI001CC68539|nr:DUF4279 domain-containing protein [Ferruginibacter albus]UAY53253.1 DUF4279 domain-containing protein [Ferruginibacter albus]
MAKLRTILYINSFSEEPRIDIIKEMLPIEATSIRQKGDQMIVNGVDKGRPNKSSCWAFEVPEIEITDIKEGLMPLLTKLIPYKDSLNKIKYHIGFETYISLVLHIKDFKTPSMSLNRFIIESLADLGLELDFDIYYE